MARRELGEDERALWGAFSKGISPLKAARRKFRREMLPPRKATPDRGASLPEDTPSPNSVVVTTRLVIAPATPAYRPIHHPHVEIGSRLPGLDDTSWNALSSGKMRPQRRLDLHGHFAQDAFERLHAFLLRAHGQGLRCVEVVTGLGSGRDGGVIRRELPHWLGRGDLRPMVLAVVHTHARNRGAVRILLRARRKP